MLLLRPFFLWWLSALVFFCCSQSICVLKRIEWAENEHSSPVYMCSMSSPISTIHTLCKFKWQAQLTDYRIISINSHSHSRMRNKRHMLVWIVPYVFISEFCRLIWKYTVFICNAYTQGYVKENRERERECVSVCVSAVKHLFDQQVWMRAIQLQTDLFGPMIRWYVPIQCIERLDIIHKQ